MGSRAQVSSSSSVFDEAMCSSAAVPEPSDDVLQGAGDQ
jgi:hypothetical protein